MNMKKHIRNVEKSIEQGFVLAGADGITVMLHDDYMAIVALDAAAFAAAKKIMRHTNHRLLEEFSDADGFSASYVLPLKHQ